MSIVFWTATSVRAFQTLTLAATTSPLNGSMASARMPQGEVRLRVLDDVHHVVAEVTDARREPRCAARGRIFAHDGVVTEHEDRRHRLERRVEGRRVLRLAALDHALVHAAVDREALAVARDQGRLTQRRCPTGSSRRATLSHSAGVAVRAVVDRGGARLTRAVGQRAGVPEDVAARAGARPRALVLGAVERVDVTAWIAVGARRLQGIARMRFPSVVLGVTPLPDVVARREAVPLLVDDPVRGDRSRGEKRW